jgi:hypothetical protein
MKFARAALLALLVGSASPAFSADLAKDYDPAETQCHFADDAELQKNLTSILDYADQALPNIPPEEDRYLTAESAAAKKVYDEELEKNNWKTPAQGQGNARYAALQARPLYTVWGVRKNIVEARKAITEILKPEPPILVTYRKNPEAEKLERATRALSSVNQYVLAMQDFLTKQSFTPSLITSDQYLRLYGGAFSLTHDLGQYMSCKLAKIMGRQSF